MKVIQCLIFMWAVTAWAADPDEKQGQSNYRIAQHSIDSGGGRSNGSNYSLTNGVGQHDGNHRATGGNFSLAGGFRYIRRGNSDLIFKNSFEPGLPF